LITKKLAATCHKSTNQSVYNNRWHKTAGSENKSNATYILFTYTKNGHNDIQRQYSAHAPNADEQGTVDDQRRKPGRGYGAGNDAEAVEHTVGTDKASQHRRPGCDHSAQQDV